MVLWLDKFHKQIPVASRLMAFHCLQAIQFHLAGTRTMLEQAREEGLVHGTCMSYLLLRTHCRQPNPANLLFQPHPTSQTPSRTYNLNLHPGQEPTSVGYHKPTITDDPYRLCLTKPPRMRMGPECSLLSLDTASMQVPAALKLTVPAERDGTTINLSFSFY